jgi:hypothetical protein
MNVEDSELPSPIKLHRRAIKPLTPMPLPKPRTITINTATGNHHKVYINPITTPLSTTNLRSTTVLHKH